MLMTILFSGGGLYVVGACAVPVLLYIRYIIYKRGGVTSSFNKNGDKLMVNIRDGEAGRNELNTLSRAVKTANAKFEANAKYERQPEAKTQRKAKTTRVRMNRKEGK
jgi:hypothetical protein